MSETMPPRWTGPARPNVDEARWQSGPQPVRSEPVPTGPSHSDRYLAEIAQNTKTIANWVTILGILVVVSVGFGLLFTILGAMANSY